MRIMIATDGSDASIEAARQGLALLEGTDPDVTLLTVVPPTIEPLMDATGFAGPVVTPGEIEAIKAANERHAHAALDVTEAAIREPGEVMHHEVVPGTDVGHAICSAAERDGSEVIVMGSSSRGWFRRLFEGPTVHYVVDHAPCPVLLIPVHGEAEEHRDADGERTGTQAQAQAEPGRRG
jgi:nucleotide-binding universal stress UspA family protein